MSAFKFSVGPWNVHEGADAYGPATRETISFEEKIKNGGVVEYTEYCGNYYGTLVSEFERAEKNGKHLILEIEEMERSL